MSCKPIIGINVDFVAATREQPAVAYVTQGYFRGIAKAGAIPVLLPPLEDEADVVALLETLDGVVLTGGRDLDPRRDRWMLHPSTRLMDPVRENMDRMLAALLAERRVPTLGVGAGMQLINLALGGTLSLHIPDDFPEALPHRDVHCRDHRHGLVVKPGSLMEKIYGDGEIRVNSMHHMAVDDLGEGLVATAHAPDGIVEAIESIAHDWFVFGVQFHPEADSATALDQGVFDEFVAQVKATMTPASELAHAA